MRDFWRERDGVCLQERETLKRKNPDKRVEIVSKLGSWKMYNV